VPALRRNWRVVDRGVNGEPFLWKRSGARCYVMINIFNPQARGCYTVLALQSSPYEKNDLNGKVIGKGCGNKRNDWIVAYQKARDIAERYMDEN
jgi:hypothetical protein